MVRFRSGGGGGGGDDNWASTASSYAERYVSDGSIKWGELVRDTAGAFVVGYFYWITDVVDFATGWIKTAIASVSTWIGDVASLLFTLPADGLETTISEVYVLVEASGILGLVVGIVIGVILLAVAERLIRTVVGGLT
ncbi:hypothetical protein [Halopiger thermotolerans]